MYFSEDLADWGAIDATGEFESSAAPHKVSFQTPVVGQYFRLVALSEANGNPWASAAEFEIKGCFYEMVSSQKQIDRPSLKAFPVPTRGIFEISLPSRDSYVYRIHSMSGQLQGSGESQPGNEFLQLDLSQLANGIYVIELQNGNGQSYFVKVLKED